MRFRVLGSLVMLDDDGPVTVPRLMVRRLLALLLSSAGKPMSADALADELWPGDAPPSARRTLQVYLHRLRRLIGEPGRLTHDGAGYTLQVGPEELDAWVFGELVAEGVSARRRGDLELAVSALERARALWRGEAYAGFHDLALVASEAARLHEAKLVAIEEQIAVGLDLGRHAVHVAELPGLVVEHPYRERLRGLLMLALYRSGRQAEALQAYREGRDLLIANVGVEPMPELQAMHRQILATDPELAGEVTGDRIGSASAWRLPNPLPDFIGRAEEREVIVRTVRAWRAGHQSAVIAINGLAGVGKTSLALNVAREIYPAYVGGQLFADLRGHVQPRSTREILHTFLRALGVAGVELPDDVEQSAARYRELLSVSPRLVLLDNVASVGQIEPLVAPIGSLTIVTSRSLLADLDGARFVSLAPLSHEDSARLLSQVLGADVRADEPAAAEVARICGRLPLALRLAAIRGLSRGYTMAELAVELGQSSDRLAGLTSAERSVRASILSGYRQLPAGQRALLLALATTTTDSFPGWIAEPLAGAEPPAAAAEPPVDDHAADAASDDDDDDDPEWARAAMRGLANSGLIEGGGDRYRMHDLVRAFAQPESSATLSEVDTVAMLDRYAAAWVAMSEQADADLVLNRARFIVNQSTREYAAPIGGYRSDPVTWFGTELPGLEVALELCERYRLDHHYWRLCWNLESYLRRVARPIDVIELCDKGLAAAVRSGDERGVACMRLSLAASYLVIDNFEEAIRHAAAGLAVAEGLADAWLTAETLGVIVQVHAGRGEFRHQLDPLQRAIELYQHAGDEASAGTKLTALGDLYAKMGATELAADAFGRGIELLRRAGAAVPLARGLRRLGQAHADAEQFELAVPLLAECLRIVRSAGEPVGELCVSAELAICHCELADPARARPYAHAARRLAEQVGMPLYGGYAALAHAVYIATTGRPDLALATARDASANLGGNKLWQLGCTLYIGRWQLMLGDTVDGQATIDAGRGEAERIGATALARRFAATAEAGPEVPG